MARLTGRRSRTWCVGLLLIILVAAGCGDDDDGGGAGGNLSTIRSGTLTVCSDVPYAPFEYEEGGDLVGIDVDLVRAIAKELDLDAAFKDTDFDGIFAALAAGQCDMIASSVSITDERKANNEFSQGYYEIQQSLLVRKADKDKYKSLDDLKGKVIGVQSETTGEAYANDHLPAGASVKSFTGVDELFQSLKANQIEAVLQDLPINAYNAEHTGETVVAAKLPSEPEQYGFVIKKGNTALRDAVDEALGELRSSGRYDEILEKYLGEAGS